MSTAMRTTVASILRSVAPSCLDSGVCADSAEGKAKIIDILDLGVEALIKRIDSEGTLFDWQIPIVQGCFPLPPFCREVRQAFLNGSPATLHDSWWQGHICRGLNYQGRANVGRELIDIGSFAVPWPTPKYNGIRVALVAENDGDAGTEIDVEVINNYGKVVREKIVLLEKQQPALGNNTCFDVTWISKPETNGPVWLLYAYENGFRYKQCEYGPKEQTGYFRRKKFTGVCPRGCNMVTIVGKLRHERITSENDILPFDDRPALNFCCQAVAAMRERDDQKYNQKLAFALNELNKQMQDADPPGNVNQVQFRSGFGRNSQASNSKCWA